MVRLPGHIPGKAIANAKWIERLNPKTEIPITFSLPLRNQQELDDLLIHIYGPTDPLYSHYLTSQEFTDRFGPTQGDYDAVAAYATSLGLKITGTHQNRTLLNVSGTAAVIESAFGLHLHNYQAPDNRKFYAPDNDPQVSNSIASLIVGVIGLDNAAVWHAHSRFVSAEGFSQISPYQIGTGPGGGLTPSDIQKAYNLTGVLANGSGQTLGLFELDGYNTSDVNQYVSYYKLPSIPLQTVLVDGFSGNAGSGASEVTLDIELQIALASGVNKIIVYESANSNTGVVDTYNRIATDNLAKQISTSWGLSEGQSSLTVINSENAIFQQMAAQGQSIYAASGDSGAYDDGSTLSVDDPASQPYMVGVGGTQLFVNSDGSYNRETTWNVNNTVNGGVGGGGVSLLWSVPTWQQGVVSAASATMRNVPDISLNADQYTGYSIYYNGGWWIFGGTSCASPVWAAFTASVNQVRAANGLPTLGFANPLIYQIAKGANYVMDFHDIADGSTNLYYPAGTGYDNATGWGSFNGANLLADLVGRSPSPPSATTNWTTYLTSNSAQLNGAVNPNGLSATFYFQWGTTTAYGNVTSTQSAGSGTGVIAVSANLAGLTAGVVYHCRLVVTNSAGTNYGLDVTFIPRVAVIVKGDFNSDGSADILWRQATTGQVYLWLMNGTTSFEQGAVRTVDPVWAIKGTGDFNGDGTADVLWRHALTGQVYLWLMNGATSIAEASPATVGDLNWQIVGIGDFNGDGKADILWRHKASGQVYIWLMNGTTIASQGSPGTVSDLNWEIKGVGDFNGDGKADILWQHAISGQVYIWLMNGTTTAAQGSPATISDLNWEIKGVGDFNGNGKSDILWRNKLSGQLYIWLMNGTTTAAQGSPATISDLNWESKGVGDFDGDGKADILWRHAVTGQVYIWLMNGTTIASVGSPGTVGDSNWTIVAR